jgi:glutathione synthase/RimK-type ligase-like ATP-grasp enzyme
VFDFLASGRAATAETAYAWFCAIAGWCWAQADITMFNRHAQFRAGNKLAVLGAAAVAGLTVPVTRVTNDRRVALQEPRDSIAKPVDGGGYCEALAKSLDVANWRDDRASAPAILQNRLGYPEYRVYIIGESILAFRIYSESLDYRRDRTPRIEPFRADSMHGAADRLLCLAAALGVDFGAADFKTDPKSGLPVFLELNTSPMFAAFDSVAGGELTDLKIAALVRNVETTGTATK